jgi:L-2-hydroxyglutarate oxidase LhgO
MKTKNKIKLGDAFKIVVQLVDRLKELFPNAQNIDLDLKKAKIKIQVRDTSKDKLKELEEFLTEEFCDDFTYYIESIDKDTIVIEIELEDCVFYE